MAKAIKKSNSTTKKTSPSATKTASKVASKTTNKIEAKKPIFDSDSMAFVHNYLNANSPTGFEASGQKLWLDYLKPYIDTHFIDSYGTAVGVINPDAPYKVVIEAHADEIAWYVKYVTADGFIYVARNGGSDHMIAPSMRVKIHTRKGIVEGVFGWPAIHVRTPENEKKPATDNIWVDVGAKDKAQITELGIRVGDVITFTDGFREGNYDYWIGRALDNRMGGVIIAEVAKMIAKNKIKLPFGLYIVNSVQEEVGLNGAGMIAERIKPDVAIVTDVTHDTSTPMMNKNAQGECFCGQGPVLSIAPAVHNILLNHILDIADAQSIPYQLQASSRFTGTDTDAFAFSNAGVPSALISLALRYMHTTVETVHKSDVENCIRLMYEAVIKLNTKETYRYL
jgi:putative aminopeptidase FrvX